MPSVSTARGGKDWQNQTYEHRLPSITALGNLNHRVGESGERSLALCHAAIVER